MATAANPNAITLTRIYDAPIQAVWNAWTIAEEVAQWWGPRGFTLTTHSRDLRVGGHWHYTMHGPDGTDYENTTQYLEVVPLSRLVYDHGGHRDRPPLFRVTALFTERDGRTRLDLTMMLASPEAAREMRGFIRKAGGEATWDRLAEYLGRTLDGVEHFVIARTFDAPIERVWAMWTDPAEFARWLPPTGATMRFLRAEPFVGGTSFYEMTTADGAVLHGLITTETLDPPTRLTYTQRFCDEHERIIRPPFFKAWPLAMRTTVDLTAESATTTRVSIRWTPMEATDEDIAEFVVQRGGMTMGWTGSLDKLEGMV